MENEEYLIRAVNKTGMLNNNTDVRGAKFDNLVSRTFVRSITRKRYTLIGIHFLTIYYVCKCC